MYHAGAIGLCNLMKYQLLQLQYDKLYSYFKTTCEPFDSLEWDGVILNVLNKNKVIEIYKYKDLRDLDILS